MRPAEHQVLEGAQLVLGLVMQPDHGEGGELEAQRRLVEQHRVAGDQPGLLQRPHAAQARRRRQPDARSERDVGHAAVRLQLLEDAPIDGVQAHGHCAVSPRRTSAPMWDAERGRRCTKLPDLASAGRALVQLSPRCVAKRYGQRRRQWRKAPSDRQRHGIHRQTAAPARGPQRVDHHHGHRRHGRADARASPMRWASTTR